jgi:hypothetical protein
MDSSDGLNASFRNGDDQIINTMRQGDGILAVDDVFVTFRRSLDPGLTNYVRFWSNGVRVAAVWTNSVFRPQSAASPRRSVVPAASSPAEEGSESTTAPFVTFRVSPIIADPGQTIEVPIRAEISGNYPIRVLSLNLNVQPLGGSPEIVTPVQFTPAAGLGAPTLSSSREPANYAAAWLDNTVQGVSGVGVIGTLSVTVPAHAAPNSVYRVEFEHISASPNGFALLPQDVKNGSVLASSSPSSWNDGIPDSWRLTHFGSVFAPEAAGNLDADSDGISNAAEFFAGTNPTDASSALRLTVTAGQAASAGSVVLRWPTVAGKSYLVECGPVLVGADWRVISTTIQGTGEEQVFSDANPSDTTRFYRVRIVE